MRAYATLAAAEIAFEEVADLIKSATDQIREGDDLAALLLLIRARDTLAALTGANLAGAPTVAGREYLQ